MNREVEKLLFKIRGVLSKAKEGQLEYDDIVYIEAPLKVWEFLVNKLRNEKK